MLDIAVYNSHQHEQTRHHGLVALAPDAAGAWRIVRPPDVPTEGDRIECIPTSSGHEIRIACDYVDDAVTGSSIELNGLLRLRLGQTHIELRGMNNRPKRSVGTLDAAAYQELRDPKQGGPAPATLGRWFEALTKLHRCTAGRADLFEQAAGFVIDPMGLDGGMILRRSGDDWQVVASDLPRPELGICFDVELVEQAAREQRTLFHHEPDEGLSVLVSPLMNRGHRVEWAVYAYRALHNENSRRGVRYLEAHLVELLAGSVRSALDRLSAEANAARRRATLLQSFEPNVVEQVELSATTLAGTEREITVLFADLRGFATLCEQLPTCDTYALLNDVMNALTAAVMSHGGTLIDYYGDGLAAMWNAPIDQPRHPQLACRAAFDMLDSLPGVSDGWQHALAAPLQLGIGIHTGRAQVGNIGSTLRLKYGPRGSTVNLASRLEQATKIVGAPILVTREVASQLSSEFIDYRVCQADLAGMQQSVDLFAICRSRNDEQLLAAITRYESALELYEAGDLENAQAQLATLAHDADVPVSFLRAQINHEVHRRLGRRASDEYINNAIQLNGK